jgi:type II restriction enzyme
MSAQQVYDKLLNESDILHAAGSISFSLNGVSIRVKERNVVGNILEEWLYKWLQEKGFNVIHNTTQNPPDFWLNPDDRESDLLEIKSFYKSPSFDIAAFMSYVNEIKEKPYRLFSDYLIIQYNMNSKTGDVSIVKAWLKKVWEISAPSERFPIKTQYKNKQIVNIRPATWYAKRAKFPTFKCKEHFISALEETIYQYPETHAVATTWKRDLCENYNRKYNERLEIPRWNDIKEEYGFRAR